MKMKKLVLLGVALVTLGVSSLTNGSVVSASVKTTKANNRQIHVIPPDGGSTRGVGLGSTGKDNPWRWN